MKINKGSKVGIVMIIIAFVIMLLLILLNKPIPSVLSWIFNAGLVISLAGSFIALSKRNDKDESTL